MAEKLIEFSEYKGKPLVRSGNFITLGNPADKAILFLTVLSTKEFHGEEIPDQIFLQVQSTAKDGEVYKQATKSGLYEALDIGSIWLDRELKK